MALPIVDLRMLIFELFSVRISGPPTVGREAAGRGREQGKGPQRVRDRAPARARPRRPAGCPIINY